MPDDFEQKHWWIMEYRVSNTAEWMQIDHLLLSELEVAGIEFMSENLRFFGLV